MSPCTAFDRAEDTDDVPEEAAGVFGVLGADLAGTAFRCDVLIGLLVSCCARVARRTASVRLYAVLEEEGDGMTS
jgi:hypothetical protein